MTTREKLEKKYGTPTTRQQLELKYNQPTGFLQNVGQDLTNRFGGLKDTFNQTARGTINPLQTGIRTVGEVAGFAGDVIGRGISAITPDAVKEKLKQTASEIVNTPIGKEGLKFAAKGFNAYEQWKKNNPQTAKDLESVVNIATLFPINKGAKIAGKGVAEAAKITAKAGEKVAEGGKYITSQATGLSPKTIDTIIEKGSKLTEAQKSGLDNMSLGTKVKNALDDRIQSLRSTGSKYEVIRRSPEVVSIPEGTTRNILAKYGIGIDDGGKLLLTKESTPLKSGDVNELQSFIDTFGNEKELSGNAFMNARTSLSNIAGFGQDKSDISKIIAKDLRKTYDDLGKSQLTGLEKLDAKYSAEKNALSQIKKEYLDKTGELKDNALIRIANATNEGRQSVLKRLEKLVPGITEEINILKALKDIEAVKGQKVGAYTSSALKSGLGGYAISGGNPVGALIGAILSSPQVAVPILKSYGKLKGITNNTINVIIDKMKKGKTLYDSEKKILNNAIIKNGDKFVKYIEDKGKKYPPGLSIKDVSKSLPDQSLIQEAKKYKSADEFIKAQTKQDYRSAHQLSLSDSITADKIDITTLKEAIRTRNGYLNNYNLSDLKKLEKLQGNPEKEIIIYRASPVEKLNDGDWVTTDKKYANDIKRQNGGKVYSYTVKVKDLRFPKDTETLPSLSMASTFSYSPKTSQLTDIWNKAHNK